MGLVMGPDGKLQLVPDTQPLPQLPNIPGGADGLGIGVAQNAPPSLAPAALPGGAYGQPKAVAFPPTLIPHVLDYLDRTNGVGPQTGLGGMGSAAQGQFGLPSDAATSRIINHIHCDTVLPDGTTVGGQVRRISDDINGRYQQDPNPNGPQAGTDLANVASDLYNGTNFRKIYGKSGADIGKLGDAGNFAYGAVAKNIGAPLRDAELAAGMYSMLTHPAKDWVGPFNMDPSATWNVPAGYTERCIKR